MSFLQPSRVSATCDECRTRFDPVKGGVCPACRRLLCGAHYYGSLLSRLHGLVGGVPRCARCRREGRVDASSGTTATGV